MRKFWWIGVIILIVIAGAIPYQQHNHLLIKKRYENIYSLLLKPEQWRKWHPEIQAAWKKDSSSISVKKRNLAFTITSPDVELDVKVNGFGFNVENDFDNHSSAYSFTVLPATNTRYADVQLIAVSSLYKDLVRWLRHTSPLNDMNSLKRFMENDDAYYGYNIRTYAAVDTNIIIEQKTVPVNSRNTTIASIRQDLYEFVNKNKLLITQPIMADIRVVYQDSIRVMVGVSVNKAVKPAGRIEIMRIPKQSKMLSVTYKGNYGNRQNVYTALKNYVRDHELLSPEVPYEKYLNNKIPLSDSDKVFMQIIAPLQ